MVLGPIVLPGALTSYQGLASLSLLIYLGSFVVGFIIGEPPGEEPSAALCCPACSGYMALVGSLILGPLWGFLHLPLFWSGHWFPPTIANIVLFVLSVIPLTIIYT